MCSQGLITEMKSQATSQLAQCLLTTEKCNRTYGSGGCAAACCFLKPATKRQTEGAEESSGQDLKIYIYVLQDTLGGLSSLAC